MLLHYHSTKDSAVGLKALGTWLRELATNLRLDPLAVEVTFQPISEGSRQKIDSLLALNDPPSKDFGHNLSVYNWVHSLRLEIPEKKLVICCSPNSSIVKAILKQNPNAEWGCNIENVSVSYVGPNKYLIWHETLHILGAEDCYDSQSLKPICPLSGCIMKYDPNEFNVSPWPFLCAPNVLRVKSKP